MEDVVFGFDDDDTDKLSERQTEQNYYFVGYEFFAPGTDDCLLDINFCVISFPLTKQEAKSVFELATEAEFRHDPPDWFDTSGDMQKSEGVAYWSEDEVTGQYNSEGLRMQLEILHHEFIERLHSGTAKRFGDKFLDFAFKTSNRAKIIRTSRQDCNYQRNRRIFELYCDENISLDEIRKTIIAEFNDDLDTTSITRAAESFHSKSYPDSAFKKRKRGRKKKNAE